MGSGSDRARWDERHSRSRNQPLSPPDAFVVGVLDELSGANLRVLDLACGVGRHALHFAARGHRVSAWDVSPVALRILSERAAQRSLEVATREIDLMTELPEGDFDLVVCVDFLSRTLFDNLHACIRPGGDAIVTTFTVDHPEPHPSPRFRLKMGELTTLANLVTRRVVEGSGRAGIWATKTA
jgi:SAM-dependent methyltransferase